MKKLILLLMLFTALRSDAGDLNAGISFVDGQRVTAAQLMALVNNATINTSFYSSQVAAGTNLLTSDIVLVLSSGNVFHKVLGSGIINNPVIFTGQPLSTTIPQYATLIYYNPTNQTVFQITDTNFITVNSSNINVALLAFANTNGGSTNTYIQVLTNLTNVPNYFSTNNQTSFIAWNSNGVPYRLTFSNLVDSITPVLGSNLSLAYQYTNNFSPWKFLNNTNATTNAYGTYTNFLITNLFFTNAAQTNPAFPTLNDSDVLPILASSQISNTAVTLNAIYQYLTNRSALPAYAVARMQFSGIPRTSYTPRTDQGNKTFLAGTNGLVGIQGVSFQFTASSGNSLPTTPQVVSNQIYYAVQTGTNTNYVQLFTNYTDAAGLVNQIAPNNSFDSSGSLSNAMLILTNFTRFNADAIALCTGSAIKTGYYDVFFRTNLTTTNYYVSTTATTASASFITVQSILSPAVGAFYSTNRLSLFESLIGASGDPGTGSLQSTQPTRIEVLVTPE